MNTPSKTITGTLEKNRKGFAFLSLDPLYTQEFDDIFLPPHEAEKYFHGDRLEVTLGRRDEIVNVRCLAHRYHRMLGRFSRSGGVHGTLVVKRKRFLEAIPLDPHDPLQDEDWILCELLHKDGPHPFRGRLLRARVLKNFGTSVPANQDTDIIASEQGLNEHHSPEVNHSTEHMTVDLETELKHRKDLREVPFFTIDGEDARDFDDAIHVEEHGDGYRLWVGIADVSHFVRPDTPLDKEAYARATSVYFPDRAFHMLPRALSENLCSLKPGVPRLVMVARMQFSKKGKRGAIDVFEAVIQSKRRATYNEIFAEWMKNKTNPDFELHPHFALYGILRKVRIDRGSIDFDLPEAKALLDQDQNPIDIVVQTRNDAHRLIEEFMIAANEAVTDWYLRSKKPFLFRVHEQPAERSVGQFQEAAGRLGVAAPRDFSPKSLATFVHRVKDHPLHFLINSLLLRSLKQAHYTIRHEMHFGLASRAYTHFTSPIRRYPDLIVHRLLRMQLRGETNQKLLKHLEPMALHCSVRERIAEGADRDAQRLKQVRWVQMNWETELGARIIEITERGMFVQIEHPWISGLVPLDQLNDDDYRFDKRSNQLIGSRTGKRFKLGQETKVFPLNADFETRQVDFRIAGMGTAAVAGGRRPNLTPDLSRKPLPRQRDRHRGKRRRPKGRPR